MKTSSIQMFGLALGSSYAASKDLLFMQGNSQKIGDSKLWSLDLSTLQATQRSTNGDARGQIPRDYMFSSRGCVCENKYYTTW